MMGESDGHHHLSLPDIGSFVGIAAWLLSGSMGLFSVDKGEESQLPIHYRDDEPGVGCSEILDSR